MARLDRLLANSNRGREFGWITVYPASCPPGAYRDVRHVSTKFPCYQGILQGNLRFPGVTRQYRGEKPLSRSYFSDNSPIKLTGKTFRRSGNLLEITGNFRATRRPEAFEQLLRSFWPMGIQCPLWSGWCCLRIWRHVSKVPNSGLMQRRKMRRYSKTSWVRAAISVGGISAPSVLAVAP
jgi:hypothetical protein